MDGGDRISGLPDELIHHILSFLPTTKLRAATSLLSRRWRPVWAHHPSLDLPFSDTYPDAAADETNYVVDHCLRSCQAPILHRFALETWLPASSSAAADRWIRFAGDRSVRNLQFVSYHSIIIPVSLFGCRSIMNLEINSCAFPNIPPDFTGFGFLKSLNLLMVSIGNEDLERLLSCCPLLSSLSIKYCDGLTFAKVKHLNHTDLILMYDEESMGARIEAPNLISITYNGDLEYLDWSGSPFLRLASIQRRLRTEFNSQEQWERLVSLVSTVDSLTVNEWFYQFVIPKPFMLKNLNNLALNFEWITGSLLNVIVCNLGECQMLEKLEIYFCNYLARRHSLRRIISDDPPTFEELLEQVDKKFEQDGCDPQELFREPRRLLCKLRTIIIPQGFMGSTNEMLLVEFLLGNAVVLEKFIVNNSLRGHEELQKLFAPIPRASSQVLLKFS